jgi:hypothetical protein
MFKLIFSFFHVIQQYFLYEGACFDSHIIQYSTRTRYVPNKAKIYAILTVFLKGQCHEIFCFRFFS